MTTMGDIFDMMKQREMLLSDYHQSVLEADDWLHVHERNSPIRKYIKGFPASFELEMYPYAYVVTNRGVNSVHTSEPPNVIVDYPNWIREKFSDTIDADIKAVQEVVQALSTRFVTDNMENPLLDMLIQQIGKGLGVLSCKRDYSITENKPTIERGTPEGDRAWDMYEDKLYTSLLWCVESLHPTHVFFDPDHAVPKDFIIKRPISRSGAVREFPDLAAKYGWGSAAEESTLATVTYVEYCSETEYACYIADMPVTKNGNAEGVAENTLGHTWYYPAFSGFGDKDATGRWDRRAIGNIQRGIPFFLSQIWDRNWLKLMKQSFVPHIIAQSSIDVDDARDQTKDFDPTYPSLLALGPSVQLSLLGAPVVPNALVMSMQADKEGMENLFGPGILSGQGTTGDEPASKYAARSEAARSPYRPAEQAAQQAWAKMLRDCVMDIKYDPDLEAGYGISYPAKDEDGSILQKFAYIKPEQIHPGLVITVDLSPMTPQDKAFLAEEAKKKQDNGWISGITAARSGGLVANPEKELGEAMAVQTIMSDQMKMILFQAMLPEIQQALGIQPQPAAPPQGQPPAPQGGGPPAPPQGAPGPALQPPGVPPEAAQGPAPNTPGSAFPSANGLYRSPNVVAPSRGY